MLLHHIQSKQELDSLCLKLPQGVQDELLRCVAFPGEGLALIAEDMEDVCKVRDIVDFETHPAEWVNPLDGNFLSALFIMNNSFAITLVLPTNVAPKSILSELED